MRFLLNGLNGREALLIDPAKANDHRVLAEKFGFTDMLAQLFGETPKCYVAEDGTGVIPIAGVIGKSLSPLEKMTGAVDVSDIADTIDEYAMNPQVTRIAFQVSSPGGTVTGVEELANKVRNIAKPTMSYTDTEMASAAYWVAAAADKVVASPSSTVGSVGVYMVVADYSEAAKAEGIKMIVIKAGQHKAIGVPGAEVTDAHQAHLQEGVDEIHADFKAAVLQTRKLVKASDMEGQVFSGKQAAQRGLVTGLADSFNEAVSMWAENSIAPAPAVPAKKK
ncbi:MAG: S49 family peptidase [Verrucomicrobiota bacterium]